MTIQEVKIDGYRYTKNGDDWLVVIENTDILTEDTIRRILKNFEVVDKIEDSG